MEDQKMQDFPSPSLIPSKHTRIMENLKGIVFRLANSDPIRPLSPSQIGLIEQRLILTFPVFHTPTHPTYSVMVDRAIKELNEENGSNEESISEYIRENFDGLPWAHTVYLSHHLSELCKTGEILCSSSRCYSKPASIQGRNWCKKRKGRLRRKRKEPVIEEGNSAGDEVSDNLVGFQEDDIQVSERSKVKRRRRSLVVVEEDDEVRGVAFFEEAPNIISSTQVVYEVSVLEDGDDITGKACGMCEEWLGIGTVGEDHDHVIVSEEQLFVDGFERKLPPTECLYEVRSPALPLDDYACKGKTEPESSVPSSVGTLHAEGKGEVEAVMGNMNHIIDRDAAKWMFIPVDCVDKSSLNTATVPNNSVDGAAELAVKESVLNEVLILPFEAYTPLSSVTAGINSISEGVDPSIICGLAYPTLEQPQRRQQVYHPKRRLKACQEKVKISLESGSSLAVDELSSQGDLETKLCATLLEYPNLKEVPVSQSQQACTSSLLKQLERQKSLDPGHHFSCLEELKSVDGEENLPLQQVLEKCGKRKKNAVQVCTVKAPLATEASSISGSELQHQCHWQKEGQPDPVTNLIVEDTSSKLWQIDKIKSHELETDRQILHPDVEMLGFVATRYLASDYLQSEPENHQKQLITESLSDPSLQNPKHQIEGQEGISRIDVRLQDLDLKPIMATSVEENVPTECEQQIKEGKRELRRRPQKQLDASTEKSRVGWGRHRKENREIKGEVVDSLNLHPQLQGLSKPESGQHSQQQSKELKKGRRGRPRKQTEATKENAVALSNLHHQEQERMSEPAIGQQSPLQIKEPKIYGQGSPRNQIEATKEDKPASHNLYLQPQEGSSELTISQHSQQTVKLLTEDGLGRPQKKKASRGRPRKQPEATNEDISASTNLHVYQQEGSSEAATHPQQHIKQLKKGGQGRPQKQEETSKEVSAASSNLHLQQLAGLSEPPTLHKKERRGSPLNQKIGTKKDATVSMKLLPGEQECQSEPATHQYSQQQNKQLKKDAQGWLWKEQEVKEDPAASRILHIQDQKGLPELVTYQGNKQLIADCLGRPQKQQKVHKEDSVASLTLLHQMEEGLSPDAIPKKLQSEIHETPETVQVMPSSGDNIHAGEHLPKTRTLTTPINNQPGQQQEEQNCPEHEGKQGKFEGQARISKEKSGKITVIEVPLSSKDQLRSRIKRQSHDST